MLVALDKDSQRVDAFDSKKYDKDGNKKIYKCPQCHSNVILKKGQVRIHHFAHDHNDINCGFGVGESEEHLKMKYEIKNIINKYNICNKIELEWPLDNFIADCYCEMVDQFNIIRKVVIECVCKNYDYDHFVAKNEYYAKNNIYVIWIFSLRTIFKNEITDEKSIPFLSAFHINSVLKKAHTLFFGKIFALDTETQKLYGIHFDYYSKEKREPNIQELDNFQLNSFVAKKPDKWIDFSRRIIQPYIKKWWETKYVD